MENALVRVMCPNLRCRRILAVPVTARGKSVKCRGCGALVKIPDGNKPAQKPAEQTEDASDIIA